MGILFLGVVACSPAEQDPAAAPPIGTQAEQGPRTENRIANDPVAQRCSNNNPLRNAYFGDLHVHTALSIDAYQQQVRTLPGDAYAFARGQEIPFHDSTAIIDRPLDFAAVTDHGEYLGELARCTSGSDPAGDSDACDRVRRGSGAAFQVLEDALAAETEGSRAQRVTRALEVLFESEDPRWNVDLCGERGERCAQAGRSAWQMVVDAAEAAQDRSADCAFTSFIGYEYSGVKTGSNYHRNIIFRNEHVPDRPVTYLDAPLDHQLWQGLDRVCTDAGTACEFLSIPHNPNLSNGKLLTPDYATAADRNSERALADLRQRAEPLMEIFQHKGQSECINGLAGIDADFDALCDVEQVRKIGGTTTVLDTELETPQCDGEPGNGGMIDTGCISKNDYLRGALLTGLLEQARLGVNPLRLGVIASTDTHESIPGAVDEQSWPGHVGRERELALRLQRMTGLPYRLEGSPGGLAGVWAVENSRDALFDAMRRRETFGTSGPRIQPRFFAGWSFETSLCDDDRWLENAYEQGVPMGADLGPATDAGGKPRFLAAALKDPEGNPLQVLQVVKGWVDASGREHVAVTDIGGDLEKSARVDTATGRLSGPGFNQLCAVYVDEAFRPEESAYYYLRVVEVPSLRWSWAQCLALAEEQRPEACDNDAPKTIHEMAWTSPVWYTP